MNREIESVYEKVCIGMEVRQGLITMKNLLKEEKNRKALAYCLKGDFHIFSDLLQDSDPKVRKNTALILGAMESDDLVATLLDAYRREETLFVKSAYLQALEDLDYEEELPYLKERLSEIDSETLTEENRKHYREEAAILQKLIRKKEKRRKHTFDGFDRQVEVILLTNREHREITRALVKEEKVTMLSGGLRFFTYNLEEVLPIRTYREILFPVRGVKSSAGTAWEMGEQLAGKILDQLKSFHKEGSPFCFRTELKSSMDSEKKAVWVKNFSAALEKESCRELVNAPSDYEVEIRLIEGKDGSCVPLMKLFTLKDERFAYRRETIAASLAPDKAALLVELSRPWLKKGAQVLDPFCGVGTLLVERAKALEADPLYGLDISGEAVEKARVNAEAAKLPIHYINRDMRDFSHEYLFDEIFSDLPLTGKNRNLLELKELYGGFLRRIPKLLKKDGMLFLYTLEDGILLNLLKDHKELVLLKKFRIQEKLGSWFFVIKYVG